MAYQKSHRKFGRVTKVRKGLMKSLALALVNENKIMTTEPRAKELRPFIEEMITSGKKSTLASQRELSSKIGKSGAAKIVKDIAPKYKERGGGYTRITKLPRRLSDGAPMAVIEFI